MSNLVKIAKLTELENKIPDVSSLGTKISLTAVENKIPSVSYLLIIIMTDALLLQSLIL